MAQPTVEFHLLLLITENDHTELSRLRAGLQLQLPLCPTPAASPLAHRRQTFVGMLDMYDEIVVDASACVLRNKMTFAMKLHYSEEEVHNANLTRSSSPNCAQRQDTDQDV